MVTACTATYGAVAYFTPITYTAILEDELEQKSMVLIDTLQGMPSAECKAYLDGFVRETGADIQVWDDRGTTLYNAADDVSYRVDEVTMSSVSGVEEEMVDVLQSITSNSTAQSGETTEVVVPVQSMETAYSDDAVAFSASSSSSSASGTLFDFVFADGTGATISITGGFRQVNQAMEALGRLLPFLIVAILLISLFASFFYARFITRPIVTASQIAGRIATLDFDARWSIPRKDEIGMLGESLNRLSDNLSETLQKLENANLALQGDIERERELDRQRLAFFSAASHELKTPVTILKGQLSGMLGRVGIYSDREKYLARALAVTDRMEGLVKEILTISRIESGSFLLKTKPLNINELIQKQLALDAELIVGKNLSVETQLLADVCIDGDERLLAIVLDNVLMNAILYSPSGASVRIILDPDTFSIENAGAFIPEASLPKLFTPFYRVEQSRNRKSGGSGLGLFLVKTILNLHGIPCKIENTERGVRFSMDFSSCTDFTP